jgi:DNA-binding Lrp family transcriptional regulator
MKNENFITIQGWMVNELSLTGNDLICYALIYGFTQNGDYWEKSHTYISEWLGVSKRSVSDILKRLVENRHIDKKEYEVNGVKFCKYKANVGNFMGSEESSSGGSEESSPHRYNNIDIKEKEIDKSISSKKSDDDAFVDHIYDMYPTKCPCREKSLGKSMKDKKLIKRLLSVYSKEEIEAVVKKEIEEKYGKSYMRNFSTFLNNFPDPSCIEAAIPQPKENKGEIIINGTKYR